MSKEDCQLFITQNLCRCCGMEKISGLNLQDLNNDRVERALKNLAILPKKVINIKSSDKLSKFVCVDCEMTLHHLSEFCEMIQKVQKNLKSQLKPKGVEHNKQDKPQKKTDCHVTGESADGSPVVICVGGDGQIKCVDCQSDLVMSQLVNLHMLTHGLHSVFCACKHCGLRDDIGNFLHHNNTIVKCPQCLFVGYQAMSSTMTTCQVRGGGRPAEGYVCEVCDQRFWTKYRYNRHKLIHIGLKPFLCETCGMKFNQKISLKLHTMKHSKINPYTCQWCGQAFRFKLSLHNHVLNIHGGPSDSCKKYECDQCRKQFATTYKLRRHYRLHTGDRPYACSVCNKRFSQTGNLKNHMKKHKLDNTFETFNTDQLLENDRILDTILDNCPQGKEYLELNQQAQQTFNMSDGGNVNKHNDADLFSDFNPQDVLFDNSPILRPPSPNTTIILPNFSSIQSGPSDIM